MGSLRSAAPAGLVDLGLNFTPGLLAGLLLGWSVLAAVVLGGVTYVTSSGIVAKVLGDLRRLGNRETPVVLSILVVEDLAMAAYLPLVTGLLVGVFAWVAGLPFAFEWGVIAFVLNYIPFIGPFVATLFPTLLAMTQFESWPAVLGVFVCLNVIQFVVGSYIEPRVAGSMLSISPVVVLFAIFFWTFLWGLFGTFIGVPITLAILTFCAAHPSSRWVADLFGGPDQMKPGKR